MLIYSSYKALWDTTPPLPGRSTFWLSTPAPPPSPPPPPPFWAGALTDSLTPGMSPFWLSGPPPPPSPGSSTFWRSTAPAVNRRIETLKTLPSHHTSYVRSKHRVVSTTQVFELDGWTLQVATSYSRGLSPQQERGPVCTLDAETIKLWDLTSYSGKNKQR